MYNTSVLFNRSGDIAATYRKIHMFEAQLDNGQAVREADAFHAGDCPVMTDIEGWATGMSVCYDLRFPELFRRYADHLVKLILIPANFTQYTGKAHWEILVRARAIENQCFVVAPNQCGTNPVTGVASYGNSMAVAPWGEILCRAGDSEELLIAELDPEQLTVARSRIPAIQHRRL